jgi:hypothetical protein
MISTHLRPLTLFPRPQGTIRSQRLPKGKTVTICIAAISNVFYGEDPYLVTASDQMVSGGIISADRVMVKLQPFHKEWFTMMSADDLTQCTPIIEKAREYFTGRANRLATARAVFKRAYSQHLVGMREDAALSGYGLSMKEFLKDGRKKLSERMYESIRKQIEEVKVGCTFLIAGFDLFGLPHIFEISENKDGGVTDHVYDNIGFAAIGSGKYIAETILYSLGQTTRRDFHQTIFNVCAAKFMAEKASDVGKPTWVYCKKRGSSAFAHASGMVEKIREEWDKKGCPRVPEGIVTQIKSIYNARCE